MWHSSGNGYADSSAAARREERVPHVHVHALAAELLADFDLSDAAKKKAPPAQAEPEPGSEEAPYSEQVEVTTSRTVNGTVTSRCWGK